MTAPGAVSQGDDLKRTWKSEAALAVLVPDVGQVLESEESHYSYASEG